MTPQREAKQLQRAIRKIPVGAIEGDLLASEADLDGLWCLVEDELSFVHASGAGAETTLDDELVSAQILRWIAAHPERVHDTHAAAVLFVRKKLNRSQP